MHTAAGGPVHSFTETSPLTNLLSNQKDFIKSFIIYLLNSSDMKKMAFLISVLFVMNNPISAQFLVEESGNTAVGVEYDSNNSL